MTASLPAEHVEISSALAAAEEALLATVGIPVERHETRLNGVRIHYLTCGEGEPLVLVHGRGSAAALFAPILAALAAGRRVIALDLPGWGLSEKPPFTGHTAADAVDVWRDALLGFLDDQGLTQTDLAGTLDGRAGGAGAGAGCSRACASPRVDRFRRAGHRDAIRCAAVFSPQTRAAEHSVRATVLCLGGRSRRRQAWAKQRGPLFDFMYAVESQRAVIPSGGRAFDKWVNLGGVHLDYRSRLKELEMPVLLLWGDRDRLIPYATALQAVRQIHTGRVVAFTGCGHSPHRERPADFARTLGAWLDGYRVPSRV